MTERGTVFRTPDGAKSQISVRRDVDHVLLTFSRPGGGTFAAKLSVAHPYAGDGSSAPSSSPRPRSAPANIDAGLPPAPGRGTGGGTSAIDKQRDALAQLIGQEQLALDLARETDPVQQEMLRNREALAGATAAERAQVEQLIAARIREEEAAWALQDAWDFMGQSAFDALSGMIVQGKSASDVIANLASSLASAALQSAFLGTGPLAGLFGTAGGGGLFGAMLPAIKRAGGGPIAGPGTATSDSILMWASNGEFMINAASAAVYRPLLEQINADKRGALLRSAPRYASGGPIGGSARGGLLAAGGPGERRIAIDLRLSGDLDARIESKSSEVAVRTVRSGLDQFNRSVLPGRVQQINADPRRKN